MSEGLPNKSLSFVLPSMARENKRPQRKIKGCSKHNSITTMWSLERLAAGLSKKMAIREENYGAGKDILTHVSENVIQWHKNGDYIWCCLYPSFLFLHGYAKYCSKKSQPRSRVKECSPVLPLHHIHSILTILLGFPSDYHQTKATQDSSRVTLEYRPPRGGLMIQGITLFESEPTNPRTGGL